jgi:hypothetical protein
MGGFERRGEHLAPKLLVAGLWQPLSKGDGLASGGPPGYFHRADGSFEMAMY